MVNDIKCYFLQGHHHIIETYHCLSLRKQPALHNVIRLQVSIILSTFLETKLSHRFFLFPLNCLCLSCVQTRVIHSRVKVKSRPLIFWPRLDVELIRPLGLDELMPSCCVCCLSTIPKKCFFSLNSYPISILFVLLQRA